MLFGRVSNPILLRGLYYFYRKYPPPPHNIMKKGPTNRKATSFHNKGPKMVKGRIPKIMDQTKNKRGQISIILDQCIIKWKCICLYYEVLVLLKLKLTLKTRRQILPWRNLVKLLETLNLFLLVFLSVLNSF